MVEFASLSGVVTDLITVWPPGTQRISTDNSGNFSITLEQGIYKVTFNAIGYLLIQVPNDSATYNVLSLITSQVVPTPWPTPPSGIPNSGTVVPGLILVDQNVSNPTCYLTTTINLGVRPYLGDSNNPAGGYVKQPVGANAGKWFLLTMTVDPMGNDVLTTVGPYTLP
jgi:hypothetical protein